MCSLSPVFTPLGFVRLFGVVSAVLVKPQFLRDLNEEYYVYSFEEDTLKRRINNAVASGKYYVIICFYVGSLTPAHYDVRTYVRVLGWDHPQRYRNTLHTWLIMSSCVLCNIRWRVSAVRRRILF